MKRITASLCIGAATILVSCCAAASEDYSGQTITGQVTEVEGTKVTLQLGELTEEEMDLQQFGRRGEDGETPPELPENGQWEGMTPPEGMEGGGEGMMPPDGEEARQAEPASEEGESENQAAEESESEDQGAEANGSEGQMPPEGGGGAGAPGGNLTRNVFTAGDETVELDFDGAEILLESGMETAEGTMEDITEDAVVTVEMGEDNLVQTVTVRFLFDGEMPENGGEMPGGGQMPEGGEMPEGGFGGSQEVTQGSAAETISSDGDYTETSYSSTGDDENALRIEGGTVALSGVTVDKSAGESSNTENGDFYGMNAALLATDGAAVTITDSVITSSAQNGNGVFSYGSGTMVTVSDTEITTTADNSGGIQTTGGGTTNASNLTVDTSGSSSAAIRSDRGGGTVFVEGGSYTTHGYNSPAVYSTADITVENAVLTAENSEALVIEGQNSIALENCDVTGNMSDTGGSSSDENVHNVMIYQSMSGDAEVGTSNFSMTGGSLTSRNGDLIYVTNTHCIITLSGVEITNEDEEGFLLNVSGNSGSRGWGEAGANGGQAEVTAADQILEGDITVDTVSTLKLSLTEGSSFTGTVNITENQSGEAVENNAVISIAEGCTWTLTGDCTVTSLDNSGTIQFNGYTITLADGTVLDS